MTAIPLPTGIQGTTDTPKLAESLINMYFNVSGQYLQRTAGIELVTTAATVICRGNTTWYVDDNAYFVIGSTLYSLDSSETLVDRGAIAGSADVEFSLGQVNLVIIVKGGNGYTYNDNDGLNEITDPDFLPSNSVDFIDGRHVFIPSDGSPAFFSEIDQGGNINPLNFFDAEELPDKNRVVINVANNLYIGGSESFELQRSTGNVQAPFGRREGARVDVGYVAGIERFQSSFMFIGRNRDENYAIHLMTQGTTKIVSNDSINELLNDEYTSSELEGSNSFSYIWKGHQLVGWNLPRHTIVTVDGSWIYLDSDLEINNTHMWNGRHITFAHGRYYIGDKTTGKIGKLVVDPNEYGDDVQYELLTFARFGRDAYLSVASLELDALTGINDTTIGLSIGRDGRAFSDFSYRDLQDKGVYNRRVRWGGGLGTYESFMGVRIRGTGQVAFTLETIIIK